MLICPPVRLLEAEDAGDQGNCNMKLDRTGSLVTLGLVDLEVKRGEELVGVGAALVLTLVASLSASLASLTVLTLRCHGNNNCATTKTIQDEIWCTNSRSVGTNQLQIYGMSWN